MENSKIISLLLIIVALFNHHLCLIRCDVIQIEPQYVDLSNKNNSKIEKVTVYLDRATVERRIPIHIAEGTNVYYLTGLSQFLQQDTVSVKGEGDATIVDISTSHLDLGRWFPSSSSSSSWPWVVSHEPKGEEEDLPADVQRFVGEEVLEQLKQIKQQTQNLQTNQAKLQSALNRVNKEEALLENLIKQHRVIDYGGSDNDNSSSNDKTKKENMMWRFITDFGQVLETIDTERFALKEQLSDIAKQLSQLQAQRDTIIAKFKGASLHQVKVTLESNKNQDGVLLLSYTVSNARWHPSYVLKVDSEKYTGQLTYTGNVWQATGEDWDDVPVFLSTAQPVSVAEPPTIKSLLVGDERRTVHHYRGKTRSAAPMHHLASKYQEAWAGAAAFDDASAARAPPSPPMPQPKMDFRPPEPSSIEAGLLSTTFQISKRAVVPSSTENTVKLTISVQELANATFTHYCVPQQSDKVYLRIRAANPSSSQLPLLSGSMNVVIDNNFVSVVQMKQHLMPGEEFETYVGTDPHVVVTARPVKEEHTELKNMLYMTTGRSLTRSYVVEIKNNRAEKINITIADRLPSSRDDNNIKIFLETPTPLLMPKTTTTRGQPADQNQQHLNQIYKKQQSGEDDKYLVIAKDIPLKQVLDQLPPYTTEFVHVDDAKNVKISKDQHIMYSVIVESKQAREVEIKYRIEYPQDYQLTLMNSEI